MIKMVVERRDIVRKQEAKICELLLPGEEDLIPKVIEKIKKWSNPDCFFKGEQILEAIRQVRQERIFQKQEEKICGFLPSKKQGLATKVRRRLDKWNRDDGSNYFEDEAQIKEAIKQVEEES
ncbi:MAG: hypothetical protein ABH808_02480 [Candidatus Kuenenbacteria bacterium]